ncbi:hypothetical protein [Streptomyces ehimensis]|uniref:Integral membrane protein n=1 Tax=Streptomyces ehimensis TaxID=68195 RepID=A0ABV9BTI7_9ACTN
MEANLWGSAMVFSSLCMLTRIGTPPHLADRIGHVTVALYLLGWVGPAAALALCAVRAKRPWIGAIIPVSLHAALGVLYGLAIWWT